MAQEVSGPQGSQTPQVSEEELATARLTVRLELFKLSIIQLRLLLSGCLSYSEGSMLISWQKWTTEALDRNDIDKAIEWAKKIAVFLKEREEACERLMNKARKHSKRYSRHSSRH